jgi:hypothetical protein
MKRVPTTSLLAMVQAVIFAQNTAPTNAWAEGTP